MDKTIGVLGGGQLGRMLAEAANRLNVKVIALDKEDAPTKQVTAHGDHVSGSFKDREAIQQLAQRCDLLTIEIEHVHVAVLKEIESQIPIHPSPAAIELIQDKYLQKQVLQKNNVAVAHSISIQANTAAELQRAGAALGYPFMLKARRDAYDGRGNFVVRSEDDLEDALTFMSSRTLYAEKWAPFVMELAVMVVKTADSILAFPTVETIHERSICKLVYAPPRRVASSVCDRAAELAKRAVQPFHGKGVFAVEMFLLPDDELLVNEIAPRPHNSGHFSIEGCYMSQYEAHLHAILDLPIPERRLRLRQPSVMLNILGGDTADAHMRLVNHALECDGTVHLYGKGAGTPGRKLGHITITAPTMAEAELQVGPLIATFDSICGESGQSSTTEPTKSDAHPLVAVLMGSDSDLPTMYAGIQTLQKLSIPHEVRITSAHRTPQLMAEVAASAVDRGLQVIIAGAGGAAHLPGMVASHTSLPVIGVPVKSSYQDGIDSLYSILQMPRGVPVATVGVGNSTNAALLAARILAVNDDNIRNALSSFAQANAQESLSKDSRMQELGAESYFEAMSKSK